MSWAEDIKQRVSIADAVGDFIQLKPSGAGRFVANCPFHQETKPSFSVNEEKGFWFCFGCKKGGDLIKFIMEFENLEFREALEFLGHKYNIPDSGLPKGKARSGLRAEGREALYKAYSFAAEFYHNVLVNTSMGAPARSYLEGRGLDPGTWKQFELGATTPSGWDALTSELLKRGSREDDLVTAGLSLKKRDGTGLIDRFRGRLIFPIRNPSGRVVALGGRALGEGEPTYINSANSPVYNKSEALYGLSQAKSAISTKSRAILVEGYMDVISLVQAGIENVIATCGTALTEGHLKVIFRHTKDVVLSFDGDDAGRSAAIKGAALVLRAGAFPRIANLPAGVDPDDFVKSEGRDAFEALVRDAPDPVSFVLDISGASSEGTSTEKEAWIARVAPIVRDAGFLRRLREDNYRTYRHVPITTKVGHLVHQRFVQTIAGRLEMDADAVKALIGTKRQDKRGKERPRGILSDPRLKIEAGVLSAILRDPSLYSSVAGEIGAEDFTVPQAKAAWSVMGAEEDAGRWEASILEREGSVPGISKFFALLVDEDHFPHGRDIDEKVKRLKEYERRQEIDSLQAELEAAERDGAWKKVSDLAERLSRLTRPPR